MGHHITYLLEEKPRYGSNGAEILTWAYNVNSKNETSLLGNDDDMRLRSVKTDLKGTKEEVVGNVQYTKKDSANTEGNASKINSQLQVEHYINALTSMFPTIFPARRGKFTGVLIKNTDQIRCRTSYTTCTAKYFALQGMVGKAT